MRTAHPHINQNKNSMKSKLIVIVRGGNIESIHATSDLIGTDVVVIDYDNLEQDTEQPEEGYNFVKVAEGEIQNKQVVEIY